MNNLIEDNKILKKNFGKIKSLINRGMVDMNYKKICDTCYDIISLGHDFWYECGICRRYLCDNCINEFEGIMGEIDCCNMHSCIIEHVNDKEDDNEKPNYVECPGCNHYMCQDHLSSYRCDYCKEECVSCELIMFGNDNGTNVSGKCLMKQIFVNNLTFNIDQYVVDIIYKYYDKFSK